MEYRTTISGRLKGALFVDAGNVWLLRADLQRPGGDFAWDRFVSEVALDAGFGIRYDPEAIASGWTLPRRCADPTGRLATGGLQRILNSSGRATRP